MRSPIDSELIFFDEAIESLVAAYRQRLKDKPELLAKEWKKVMKQDADMFFYDDDWVLLVDEVSKNEPKE